MLYQSALQDRARHTQNVTALPPETDTPITGGPPSPEHRTNLINLESPATSTPAGNW